MTPADQRPNALDNTANREPMIPGQDRWWAGRRGRGVARAQKMRKQLLEQAQKIPPVTQRTHFAGVFA